jgi:hypothetical protein
MSFEDLREEENRDVSYNLPGERRGKQAQECSFKGWRSGA